MMGACTQPENLMIIMEYMQNGSVDDLIHGKKNNFLSFEQRIAMAKDCCLGMVLFPYIFKPHHQWCSDQFSTNSDPWARTGFTK